MRRLTFGMVTMLLISVWVTAIPLQMASSFADPDFQAQWQESADTIYPKTVDSYVVGQVLTDRGTGNGSLWS